MFNDLFTVTCGSMKKVFPIDKIQQDSNKNDMKPTLRKVVKEVGVGIGGGEALRGRSGYFSPLSWAGH